MAPKLALLPTSQIQRGFYFRKKNLGAFVERVELRDLEQRLQQRNHICIAYLVSEVLLFQIPGTFELAKLSDLLAWVKDGKA
ncbi:hypothetical protein BS78_04G291700 [Paspalum vaginatum]|nr:hypothetical protein BS78_04G291700 [Paspalum vaginatum]